MKVNPRSFLSNKTAFHISYSVRRCVQLDSHALLHRCRLPASVRVDLNEGAECQPGCRRATTDYQRLDPDAEEGHRWCGDIQTAVDGVPWRVWNNDRQRQLLAGTGKDVPSAAVWQRQTPNWGKYNCSSFSVNNGLSSFNSLSFRYSESGVESLTDHSRTVDR